MTIIYVRMTIAIDHVFYTPIYCNNYNVHCQQLFSLVWMQSYPEHLVMHALDSCLPTAGCVSTDIICNDNNYCMDDSCETTVGCVYTTTSCNDDNSTVNTCDQSAGCTYTPLCCNFWLSCPSCSGCKHNTTQCFSVDKCQSFTLDAIKGWCEHQPVDCDDDNVCMYDCCDTSTGCSNTNCMQQS